MKNAELDEDWVQSIVKMEIALSSYTRCLLSDLSLMFLMEKVLFSVLSIVMR